MRSTGKQQKCPSSCVDYHVKDVGKNTIGTDRKSINTGIDGLTESRMSGITGDQVAYKGETGNVTMRGQENFRMKVISNKGPNMPRNSLATFNLPDSKTRSFGGDALGSTRGTSSPTGTTAGVTWDAMKSWLNHEFTTDYVMDDADQIVETITRVTDDVNEDRPPPDPDIHYDDSREP